MRPHFPQTVSHGSEDKGGIIGEKIHPLKTRTLSDINIHRPENLFQPSERVRNCFPTEMHPNR